MPVDSRSQVLQLPRRIPSPRRVRSCTALVEQDPAAAGATAWTFAKEIVLLDALLARQPSVAAEVQVLQLGPAMIASLPGEMFCQLGLDLKAAGLAPFTFPVELANGCVGYVPTAEALGEHGGGYETRLTSYTNLQPDAGARMRDTALGLMRQLKPSPPVSTRPAPAFTEPWTYGNVPPELE
jgi:hypothetical protein